MKHASKIGFVMMIAFDEGHITQSLYKGVAL